MTPNPLARGHLTDCVTVRINAPVAWSVTVRTRAAAVGVANTLPTYLLELVTVASLSFAF